MNEQRTNEEEIENIRKNMIEKYKNNEKFDMNDFRMIIRLLRNREYGCPWDSVQTHESIIQCLIEECYEAVEAIKDKDDYNMCEELGDILMQVVMHSEMAFERNVFGFDDVVDGISRKMVRRHPKIFTVNSSDNHGTGDTQNLSLWEQIKRQEKEGTRESKKGELGRVATSLPALIRAQKVIKKSGQIYGDRKSAVDSVESIRKSLDDLEKELRENKNGAAEPNNKYSNIDKILGTILLEITNVAYIMEENAENSLTNAIEQFINKHERDKH